jgi:hypothetical protein
MPTFRGECHETAETRKGDLINLTGNVIIACWQYLNYMAWNCKLIDYWWNWNYLARSGRGQFEVLFQNFLTWIEENQGELQEVGRCTDWDSYPPLPEEESGTMELHQTAWCLFVIRLVSKALLYLSESFVMTYSFPPTCFELELLCFPFHGMRSNYKI